MTEPNHHRRSVIGNGSWSALQQAVSTGAGSVVSFLLIVVLPVDEFGVYSYALALVSIGMSVTTGGLNNLAVRDLVHQPERVGRIVAGLMLIREMFALVGYLLILVLSLTSGSLATIAATAFAGVALFSRAADGPELWYRATMRSRVPSLARIVVACVALAVRLLAIWLWPSIWVFIALFVLEAVAAGVWIVARFLLDRQAPALKRPSRGEVRETVKSSTPLLLSGLANQINLRGDVVIIQAMLGLSAVGVYSAAARISELAYFLPVVFMNASFPVMLQLRRTHGAAHEKYHRFLQGSYDRAFWTGILVAVLVGAAGTAIITFVFGPEYEPAVTVLWISLVACPFVFMGAVYSKWIIAEGYLWSSLVRHGVGAVANIGLNIALIPVIGIIGSAVATVSSYILASYFACFFGRASRAAGLQMTLAFVAPVRIAARYLRDRDR